MSMERPTLVSMTAFTVKWERSSHVNAVRGLLALYSKTAASPRWCGKNLRGRNERWWENSSGFKPRAKKTTSSDDKKKSKPTATVDKKFNDSPYIVGANARYMAKEGEDYIVGLELKYSHGPSAKWGRVVGTKKCAELPF